jgi:hypothetical protein
MIIQMLETSRYYTKKKKYRAKRIFEYWSWMIMAWDKFGVGRFIHGGDYGKFRITDERVTNGEGVQNGEEKGNRKKDV